MNWEDFVNKHKCFVPEISEAEFLKQNAETLAERMALARAEVAENQSRGRALVQDDLVNLSITLGCVKTVEELLEMI